MTLRLRQLAPALGVEVSGIDLTGSIDEGDAAQISPAFEQFGVVVIRDQPLDVHAHARFAARFGRLGTFRRPADRDGMVPEIFRLANTDLDGKLLPEGSDYLRTLQLNQLWHSDSSYLPIPNLGTVLRCLEVPDEGGDTIFASMIAAFEDLPRARRESLVGLYAMHSFEYLVTSRALPALSDQDRARMPAVKQPLVRAHLDGRRSLFLSPPYMETIVGWDAGRSHAFVAELTEWATQERYTYRHRWRPDDVVMWRNDCTLHRVTDYDMLRSPRVMHGTTLLGTHPAMPASSRDEEQSQDD
jgi:alpha-ketoglutarate-dependent taurine dioxygenase